MKSRSNQNRPQLAANRVTRPFSVSKLSSFLKKSQKGSKQGAVPDTSAQRHRKNYRKPEKKEKNFSAQLLFSLFFPFLTLPYNGKVSMGIKFRPAYGKAGKQKHRWTLLRRCFCMITILWDCRRMPISVKAQ